MMAASRSFFRKCQFIGSLFSNKLRTHAYACVSRKRVKYVGTGLITGFAAYGLSSSCIHAAEDNSLFMAVPITKEISKDPGSMRSQMELFTLKVQSDLCARIKEFEPSENFEVDRWVRPSGGGISCVLQDGEVFEKAAVNISVSNGRLPSTLTKVMKTVGKNIKDENTPIIVRSISVILHPRNPMVPTLHFNFRYFEFENSKGGTTWWFGGGIDLTPYYVNEMDFTHFHTVLKTVCDKFDVNYYPNFKKWCDEYFHLSHRKEHRGIGGIFFDELKSPNQAEAFKFIQECTAAVIPAYFPLVVKHKDDRYGTIERNWQLERRGRYVEFNLLQDRGTKFGLSKLDKRTESIMVSLPLTAKWKYNSKPLPGSAEEDMLKILQQPREWAKST